MTSHRLVAGFPILLEAEPQSGRELVLHSIALAYVFARWENPRDNTDRIGFGYGRACAFRRQGGDDFPRCAMKRTDDLLVFKKERIVSRGKSHDRIGKVEAVIDESPPVQRGGSYEVLDD